jgi:Na+/H+ antiporter NhaA
MFCGGRRCKYETSSQWKPEDMAVTGIYSHWITDELVKLFFLFFGKKLVKTYKYADVRIQSYERKLPAL